LTNSLLEKSSSNLSLRKINVESILEILAVSAIIITISLFLWDALSENEAPPGMDPGNWLSFAKQLFGEYETLAESSYPPVLPFLLRLFMVFFNDVLAVKLLGVIIFSFQFIPAYLIAKRMTGRIVGGAVAITFVFSGYSLETYAYGGYSLILGVSFLMMSLYEYTKISGNGFSNWKQFVTTSIWISLLVGTHHLSLILFLFILLVFIICRIFVGTNSMQKNLFRELHRLKYVLVFSVILSLAFLPTYYEILTSFKTDPFGPQGFSKSTDINQLLAYIFKDNSYLYTGLFALTIFAIIHPSIKIRTEDKSVVISILVASFSLFIILSEIRFLYLINFAILLGFAVMIKSSGDRILSESKKVAAIVITILIFFAIVAYSIEYFPETFGFYLPLTANHLNALSWIKNCSPNDIIVISEPNYSGSYISWWIEGVAEKPAVSFGDIRWLNYEREIEYAQLANYVISRESANELHHEMVKNKMQIIFLDKNSNYDVRLLNYEHGLKTLFENEGTLILGYNVTEKC